LQSTAIIVNQNAASSQYLSFRYFLQGEPFRYVDVAVGIDQGEIFFHNPATIQELTTEVGKVWTIILQTLTPNIPKTYFEATLHCETEQPGANKFLSEMVRVPSNDSEIRKGFSISTGHGDDIKKLTLEVSESVQDGLYVVFASLDKTVLNDLSALSNVFTSTVASYRKLQDMASIQILERNSDGTFTKRN
jgi:hypothetical protein